jgi:tetratricopeptide (TPR) repeat protein
VLLWCFLRLPDLLDEERDEIKQRLQDWRASRRAFHHYRRALDHAKKGELQRAMEELSETVQLNPASADAFRERGSLALRCSDPQRALADFSQALELQPGMAPAFLGRGQALLKLGRFEQAIGDFTEALRLAPWDSQAFFRRGLAHAARKQHEQAVDDFTEAIRLSPEVADAYMHRAIACTQLGRLDQAIRDYSEQIQLAPNSSLAYNFRARLYYRQRQFAAALADHQKADELDPANPNTLCQLAWIWAACPDRTQRNGPKAIEVATRACELTEWKKAQCLDTLAAALAEAGQFAQAADRAQEAVNLASDADKPNYTAHLEAFRQGHPWRDLEVQKK